MTKRVPFNCKSYELNNTKHANQRHRTMAEAHTVALSLGLLQTLFIGYKVLQTINRPLGFFSLFPQQYKQFSNSKL